MSPRQLSLDLPVRTVLGRDDFFVAPSNAMAVAMIDAPERWGVPQLALTGPEGSGKTHLAHVWAAANGARIVAARDLAGLDLPELADGPVAVEDVPAIASDAVGLEALFHLWNLTNATRTRLLMTGRTPPRHWGLALPDAQSRVDAACHVALEPPDDALLGAVLAKLFADRQLTPPADTIAYVVRHGERSFAAAADTVARIDRRALEQGRKVSRALAAEVLGEAGGQG